VGEWLRFTLTVHRLSGSDYHHYMVTYATDRKDTAREGRAGSTRPCTALASADRAARLRAHRCRASRHAQLPQRSAGCCHVSHLAANGPEILPAAGYEINHVISLELASRE
jgi:hypothetical protein